MAPALVQHVHGNTFGTSLAVTCAATGGTSGRLMTACVQAQTGTTALPAGSVTDSAGGTWTQANWIAPTSQKHIEIWYRLNAPSGITSVTCTIASGANINMTVQEWSGTSGYALRNSATATGSGGTPAGAPVGAQNGDVIVTILGYLEATSGTRQDTIATGTVLDIEARGTTAMSSAYMLPTSTVTANPTWTLSPSVSTAFVSTSYGATNIAPTANAGPDQSSIEPFSIVTLDGSASNDPDGTIATYAWSQTAGPTVTLSSTSVVNPTFTAPATLAGTTLTFSLVVTDNSGASSTADTVNIAVVPHTIWQTGSTYRAVQLLQL